MWLLPANSLVGMNVSFTSFFQFAVGLVCGGAATALAQGSFQCTNALLKNASVTDCAGTPVGGTNYLIEVRAENPQSGQMVGGLLSFDAEGTHPLGTVKLFSERNPGRFSAGTVLVPFVAPGSEATLEFRAWDQRTGATYDTATRRGASVAKVLLGGAGNPPTLPNSLTRFTGIKICEIAPVTK